MNLRSSFHKTVDDVSTSPRIQTGHDGIFLRSIVGTTAAMGRVMRLLLDREYDLSQLLAIGTNVDDVGSCMMHMLMLDTDPGASPMASRANVTYDVIDTNRQVGYDYANQIGTMALEGGDYIQIATWSNGLQTLHPDQAQDVLESVFAELFDHEGRVRGAKGKDIRTILLIGTEVERVSYVSLAGQTFLAIPETDFGEQERHLILKDSLIVAELGGQAIVGLKASAIEKFLRDPHGELTWVRNRLSYGKILDLAVVDGAKHSTVITLTSGSDYAYLPACFRWRGEDVLEIKTDVATATTVGMIGGRNYDPIVRISPWGSEMALTASPRFTTVTVDQNNHCDFAIGFRPSTDLPTRFALTARTAASDDLYERAS